MTTDRKEYDIMEHIAHGSVEPSERWVRVKLNGETIADSKNPILLIQFGRDVMPTYFFTHDEVKMEHLSAPIERGGKRLWTVQIGDEQVKNGAWTYIDPPEHLAAVQGRVTFNWRNFEWYEEDEQVFVHARDPHKRVDVMRSTRHVQIKVDGKIVADTISPYLLYETHLPIRYYIPAEDVKKEFLTETSHKTACPYKGNARYWTVKVGEKVLDNVAWSYPDPIPEITKIKDLICFFNERTDIYVDGELMERPITPWSTA